MNFVRRNGYLYIENIRKEEIKFSNLGAKEINGNENPDHVYVLWINDQDLLEYLRNENAIVKEIPNINDPNIVRYTCQFKAYPKIRFNPRTGKDEVYPKVVLKDGNVSKRLTIEEFSAADGFYISEAFMRFHIYESDYRGTHYIPVIDELWCVTDPSVSKGGSDDDYLAAKLGADDEVPFV